MKPVILSHRQWQRVHDMIIKDYPFSVARISWKRKEKLGFTVREHSQWVENKDFSREYEKYQKDLTDPGCWLRAEPVKGTSQPVVCLDFYDEKKRTLFLLKYGDVAGGA